MGLRHHEHENISPTHHAGHYARTLHVFVEIRCQDTSPIASTCNITYIHIMYSNMKNEYHLHITQATMCAPWATSAISNAKVKLFWSSTTSAFASSRRRSTDASPRSAQMASGMSPQRKPPKGSIFSWILILASTSFLYLFNVECVTFLKRRLPNGSFFCVTFFCAFACMFLVFVFFSTWQIPYLEKEAAKNVIFSYLYFRVFTCVYLIFFGFQCRIGCSQREAKGGFFLVFTGTK